MRFGLIGAAGYVAPRHMRAIKDVGGDLVAALDPSDSVGVIDNYFPNAHFFTEFERFDRHIYKQVRENAPLDYISICSPNHLHDTHCRFALRAGSNAICEKPLVLNSWNINGLEEIEQDTGNRIYTILQLRLHPSIIALKEKVEANPDKIHDLDLTYITSRGRWYQVSWKGDIEKSGGVATNIGVHFFDMLCFVFGSLKSNNVHIRDDQSAAGYLEFERARVRWFLSVSSAFLPKSVADDGITTYRSIDMDGQEIEFSGGFTDLHTESYKAILNGKGFGISEVRSSIEIVSEFNRMPIDLANGELHPIAEHIIRS